MTQLPQPLPANVLSAIQRGNAIEAIQLLRASTGLGWKEARDVVNLGLRSGPAQATKAATPHSLPMAVAVAAALRTEDPAKALRLLREKTGLGLKPAKDAAEPVGSKAPAGTSGLAPGEVPRSNNSRWLAAVLVAAAFLAYRIFGRWG